MGKPTDSDASFMTAAVVCPACGKAVDPLRAGHVAILEGGFRYFCDETCKRSFVGRSDGPMPSQVETAEPPRVARIEERAPSSPRVRVPEPAPPSAAPIVVEPPRPVAARIITPTPTTALPLPVTPLRAYAVHTIHLTGVVAGILAPCLVLLGPGAQSARLALATLSVAACCARALVVPYDPSDVRPFASVSSVVAVWGVAFYARGLGDPHAFGLASVAGLAAAVHLIGAVLVDRAREGVRSARGWLTHRLDVPVRIVSGEETVVASAAYVKPGEEIVALAGDTLGVDARVIAGDATVTPWLDAPLELSKREGDPIVAGARVVRGSLRAMTTWAGPDRAWLKLATSSEHRPDVVGPLARLVRLSLERGAIVAAVVVAALGMANGATGVDVLAMAAVAAFCVAGSGAAGIVALHQARGPISALSHGVVYRDAASFDVAGQVEVAVLCSRGTLLMGSPEIVALETLSTLDERRVLAVAAGASAASTHPANGALRDAARARNERPESVRHANYHPGLGVTALTAKGDAVVVGSRALLLREKVSIAIADARVTELEGEGRSVTLVALAGKLVGLVALQDGLRPGARAAVQRLLDAHVEPVILSGEARETCETIGRALDVEHIRPEVLPADRGTEVKALGEGGRVVAALGHPGDDDAALFAAPVSIALGAAGGTPGEWSIALASNDIRDAARALSIAREARERTKIAIALGLAPGAVAAIAIALGVVPLALGPLLALSGLAASVVHART